MYEPRTDDYKIWLVINPVKWLVPIWIAALAVAVIVHMFVLNSPKYDFLAHGGAAQVESE